jgi:hypothetical protein
MGFGAWGILLMAGVLVVDECTARGTVFTIGQGAALPLRYGREAAALRLHRTRFRE